MEKTKKPAPFVFFLDMDGVLNNPRVCYSMPSQNASDMFGWIDPISVAFINKWANYIDEKYNGEAHIVMSSTWRSHFDRWESISTFYSALGLYLIAHKDFKTRPTRMSIDGQYDIRGNQVADWLKLHPDVDKWIIIDDSNDFRDDQIARHVHTDTEDGILGKNHRDAMTMIKNIYDGKI